MKCLDESRGMLIKELFDNVITMALWGEDIFYL